MTYLTAAVGAVFILVGLWNLFDPKLRFYRDVDAIVSDEPGTAERWAGRGIGLVLVAGGPLIVFLGS